MAAITKENLIIEIVDADTGAIVVCDRFDHCVECDEGIGHAVYASEDSARAHFARMVQASWASEFGDERPMPEDTMDAYHDMTCRPFFNDFLSIEECEVKP